MTKTNAEKAYIGWLVETMNIVKEKNYGMLLRELYRKEFYAVVKYDEDRGEDGLALRNNWADEFGYRGPISFGPPTVLETIIGISLRIEDQIFGGPWADEWDYKKIFWNLLDNLGLTEFDGVLSKSDYDKIVTLLDEFLSKTSHCDTFANIFIFSVTEIPPRNLKKMNLWSQMHAYIAKKWPTRSYL